MTKANTSEISIVRFLSSAKWMITVLVALTHFSRPAQAQSWTYADSSIYSGSVTWNTAIGINWHDVPGTYAIFRTPGDWSDPYSQLKIRFPTGIILQAGEDNWSSYTKSYVEIGGGGKGLMVTAGNVGIGTTNPSSKLHVVGDVTVEGNISAKYQDIAEWVPAAVPIAVGTVVIQDSANANLVIPSNQPYDTRVAGVVSPNPGLVLGEAGEGKVRVATTGRVKVRVDATRAPVLPGDLLVTSDKEGVAMKSEPIEISGRKFHQPGTLIGKALEPLAGGEGEILVLLSLQ